MDLMPEEALTEDFTEKLSLNASLRSTNQRYRCACAIPG